MMTFHEKDRLVRYMNLIYERAVTAIGYPFATDYNYSELYPLLRYALNNLRHPFIEATFDVSSRTIKREVVEFFADLSPAPAHNGWGM